MRRGSGQADARFRLSGPPEVTSKASTSSPQLSDEEIEDASDRVVVWGSIQRSRDNDSPLFLEKRGVG